MRYQLSLDQIPSAWFNVLPVMPEPLQPPLHPATNEPVGPDDLAPLFPMGLIAQEVSTEPWIDVPGEVLDILQALAADAAGAGRASRACPRHAGADLLQGRVGLARRARTSPTPPCRRPSTTRPRASRASSTETGAGQWGTALVVRVRAVRPRVQGVHGAGVVRAEAVPQDPDGDVGCARSCRRPSTTPTIPARSASPSATRCATPATRDDTHYSLGSVLNHVLLHQTVIGLEAKEQLALAGEGRPDVVIGCCGGGSNLGRHRAAVRARHRRAPRRGRAVVVPDAHRRALRLRLRRHRGHDAAPADVHARPRLRAAVDPRRRAALPRRRADHLDPREERAHGGVAYPQGKTFEAAVQFARTEGQDPRPRDRPRDARRHRRSARGEGDGEERVILFNFSGHGLLDLSAYDDYLNGRLIDG